MTAHVILRARTSAAHTAIDAAYSQFDLGDRACYSAFLEAHARVVPALEAVLTEAELPAWRPRTALLQKDIEAFGLQLPEPLGIGRNLSAAEQWGLLYVLEGSRLGGRLLSRRVPHEFPSEYLSAAHEAGEWRNFIQALNSRAKLDGTAWLDSVVSGANLGFAFYGESAAALLPL